MVVHENKYKLYRSRTEVQGDYRHLNKKQNKNLLPQQYTKVLVTLYVFCTE